MCTDLLNDYNSSKVARRKSKSPTVQNYRMLFCVERKEWATNSYFEIKFLLVLAKTLVQYKEKGNYLIKSVGTVIGQYEVRGSLLGSVFKIRKVKLERFLASLEQEDFITNKLGILSKEGIQDYLKKHTYGEEQ